MVEQAPPEETAHHFLSQSKVQVEVLDPTDFLLDVVPWAIRKDSVSQIRVRSRSKYIGLSETQDHSLKFESRVGSRASQSCRIPGCATEL